MTFSAQRLDAILDEVKAGKYAGHLSKPEVVSEGEDGIILSLPINDNTANILFRRRPNGIWEIEADAPKAALDYFASAGVIDAAVSLLREVNAAAQQEFRSDDIYQIRQLVNQAFEDANRSPAAMSKDTLLARYRALRK